MRSPHVVVIATLADLGGAERSLLELVGRLRAALRFTVVLPEDGPLATAAVEAGAAVRVLTWPPAFATLGERVPGRVRVSAVLRTARVLPSLRARLRALVAELDPDIVVTNGIKAHVLGALARRSGGPPLVWYAREGLEDRRWSRLALGLVGRRSDGAIAISHYVAREFAGVLPSHAPVRVVYNIVDETRFRPGTPPPTDLPKPEGEIWFGVVGALAPLKGQDLFLRAAARVAPVLPRARFLVVGGSPYRTRTGRGWATALRTLAARLGIAERVTFLGHRADVAPVIANLDVLVQPNRGPEGLGRAVLEAMACGVPVVAVDRWGPREIVRDGETGFLTPHLDVDALAARMEALGSDPALRTRIGSAGRAWVTAHCAPDVLARIFHDALRCWLAARPPRALRARLKTWSASADRP